MDLGLPRTVAEIIRDAARLYASLPLLFIFLTGVVFVPYEVVVLLIENGKSTPPVSTELLLLLVALALVSPCIAALQVQVLLTLADHRQPRIADVIKRGLKVLPVVAAAQIIAAICLVVGLLLLIVPGVIVWIRLAVVAPVAATERTDWPGALRRSAQLTAGNAWRTAGLLLFTIILGQIPAQITSGGAHVATAVIGIALAVVVQSYVTLMVNLLYFDLRARQAAVPII